MHAYHSAPVGAARRPDYCTRRAVFSAPRALARAGVRKTVGASGSHAEDAAQPRPLGSARAGHSRQAANAGAR